MPEINQHIEAACKVYEIYWDSYLKGDLGTFAPTLDDNYEMIGTSESEVVHNKAEGIAFFKSQMQEMAGKAEMRNRQISAKPMNGMLLINEHCDIFVLAGTGWSFYSKIRISTFLHETQLGWKVIQQHGSLPDIRVQEGETLAIDKISRENVELRDAVKRRTAELEHKNRELEIEAALERVRVQTMAMQCPDELEKVNKEIINQLKWLQVPGLTGVTFYLTDEHGWVKAWDFSSPGNIGDLNSYTLQFDFKKYEMMGYPFKILRQTDLDYFVADYPLKKLKRAVYELEEINPAVASVFKQALSNGILTHQWTACARIRDGLLGIDLVSPPSEDTKTIVLKIAGAFNQAYIRFLDLRKAEAQAKEARLELSLERIRAQVTAMQESSELLDIVVTMRTEFVQLGHEAHYFWYMRWLPEKYEKAMTSGDGTRIGMVMSLPRHIHGDVKLVADWEKSDETTVVFAMNEDTAVDYVHKMITLGDFEQVDPQAPTLDDIRHIGGLTFVMARTTHGEIGFSLPGMVPDPPKDAVETLARFAGVFDLAYQRFEDLKTAEKDLIEIKAARQKAEDALTELKSTQTQLIQQEKLASLGQLTAGIAHEIKNPLNFVNNFSDVSIEMIDEALDGLAIVKTQHAASPQHPESPLEAIQETETILQDIKSNLRKIHEHGTRANGIVSSMLQHSRGGSGKMEPTDLNALIREYVNLAFHGMRAGKNPINVDIQLDLDEKLGNVNLISEDFSRVVLNLVNNAFDAMRETADKRLPKLTIRTKLELKHVLIEVEDNGPGIPDEIKNKILQPFFTTKKGTEGTGLGLSITHDIVKAHGGELEIETVVNKGTKFIIKLAK